VHYFVEKINRRQRSK